MIEEFKSYEEIRSTTFITIWMNFCCRGKREEAKKYLKVH